MRIIRTLADASTILDSELQSLVGRVFDSVSEFPEILYFILIVESGDSTAMVDAQLGFPILSTRHEILEEHAGYFELVFVISDDGSGIEVLIPKSIDLPELLTRCAMQVLPQQVTP